MKKRWSRGYLGRTWNSEMFNQFPYVRQPITQEEINDWVDKGYDHVKSFTGTMYDSRNPMPSWVEQVGKLFDLNNITYTFYKMQTLEIMPEHVDHYSTYMKLFGVEYKNVRRVLIMLEDWKPGHYLEIDGVGIVNWIAGEWFMWDSDVPHAASNIGVEDRYTLQLTGEVLRSEEAMQALHWFNISDLDEKLISSLTPFMSVVKKDLGSDPTFVYMYNQHLTELETIRHTANAIEQLNERGLKIYLNEPLCSYIEGSPIIQSSDNKQTGTKHNMWFYSEFDHATNPQQMRADELDSISTYIKQNNLTNVTVFTGDYDVANMYPYYTPDMKLSTDDIFIKTQYNLRRENNSPINNIFTKKFICLNWRYSRHRFLMAAYLANTSSIVSWFFKADISVLNRSPWLKIFETWPTHYKEHYNKLLEGIIYLNRSSPLNVDIHLDEATAITDSYFFNPLPVGKVINEIISPGPENYENLRKFYDDVFVDVVTESRYAQPTGNFSEKTLQAVFFKKPFILVAPPKTLEYLHTLGFKTFNEFWDESYDNEQDHEVRIVKILKIIDMINDKSIDELQELYEKMKEIVEHNFEIANQIILETPR
jgi:hypothetical protein